MSLISELGPLLFLAAILGLLMARVGQPPLLGYLLAGMAAGAGAFGIIGHTGTIEALGDLGIVLLLFYLGLELSWRKMAPIAGRSFVLAMVVVGVPFLFLHNILLLAGVAGLTAAVAAFILSVNSTAIGVQALEVRGQFHGRTAHLLIGINLVVDILAILALAAFGAGAKSDGSIGLLLLKTAGFTAACATLGVAIVPRALDAIQAHAASRLLMPITLIALGLMVAYAGSLIGVPISVGAFLAGALAAEAASRDELEACLHPIKELFLGVFFVAVGFQVDLADLPRLLPFALGLAVLVLLVRFASVTATAYAAGEEPDTSLALGAAFIPIGEFSILLVSTVALPAAWSEGLLGVIILMMFLMSLAVEPLLAAAPHLEKRLAHRAPGAVRHLLYIVRGALAPALSPVSPANNKVRVAFRDLALTMIVLVGLGVGIGGTSSWLNRVTPHWIDFELLGLLAGVAILVPGLVLGWRQWQKLLTALVGAYKTGPGTERIRLIQRATRGALTTLTLGLFGLATLPYVFTLSRGDRLLLAAAAVAAGLVLAFLFRKSVVRLHTLLVSGMWGAGPPRPGR